MGDPESPNRELLERVNAAGAWFRARKTLGLWARRLAERRTVDGREGPLQAEAGDYLCRGVQGEFWPQSEASLLEKYEPTEEVDGDGFRRYAVKDTEQADVLAAKLEAPVTLKTSWGDMQGSAGDFLAKRYVDRDVALPDDVWIVSASVFAESYTEVASA